MIWLVQFGHSLILRLFLVLKQNYVVRLAFISQIFNLLPLHTRFLRSHRLWFWQHSLLAHLRNVLLLDLIYRLHRHNCLFVETGDKLFLLTLNYLWHNWLQLFKLIILTFDFLKRQYLVETAFDLHRIPLTAAGHFDSIPIVAMYQPFIQQINVLLNLPFLRINHIALVLSPFCRTSLATALYHVNLLITRLLLLLHLLIQQVCDVFPVGRTWLVDELFQGLFFKCGPRVAWLHSNRWFLLNYFWLLFYHLLFEY